MQGFSDISDRQLGQEGEVLAAQFLKAKGFQILEKNYRCRLGEVDLIVEDKDRLVFVEVKTRRDSQTVSPRELISRNKQIHISKVAQHYLAQKKNQKTQKTSSFAVLIVDWSLGQPEVEFIDDAFDLGWGY